MTRLKAVGTSAPSKGQMTTMGLHALGILAGAALMSTSLAGSPQESTGGGPVSVERIRKAVQASPGPRLKLDSPPPTATFRVTIEQPAFMPSFEEHLRKEFALNHFQRQSQEWRSKCCGINLLAIPEHLTGARRRLDEHRIREQIAREAAELEAASTK